MEWVLKAGELAASGSVQAIATAPINKEACRLAGHRDVGHMEIFQSQTGASEVATMLMAGGLRVVHLTTHRSLRAACDYVTRDNVLAKIELTDRSFREWGWASPRIGVAALNPHASDGGLIGDEEAREIAPAVEAARTRGVDAAGPIPADTVFNQAIDGAYDAVLAMYHDQGHIPVKVHDWARSVSVNLGLPFIRTSVDHGTAFDIAWRGIADHESMLEAIKGGRQPGRRQTAALIGRCTPVDPSPVHGGRFRKAGYSKRLMTPSPADGGRLGWGRRESERDGGQVLDMKISFVGGGSDGRGAAGRHTGGRYRLRR